ncbi:MAG: hydrogenase maturation protease [Candidatus Brocadiia bacterium]
MDASTAPTEVAVIGIGNLLLMDEGLGVHALRELEQEVQSDGVRCIDGGTDPWSALSAAEGCRGLVLLDAVLGGKTPGEFHRMELEQVEASDAVMSLHGLSMFHLVQYEALLGRSYTETLVLGMEPEVIEPGIGLSERCRRRLPEFVRMARAEITAVRERLGPQ